MSIKQDIHIVWYKRDLRVDDHAPMREAAADGACFASVCGRASLLAAKILITLALVLYL